VSPQFAFVPPTPTTSARPTTPPHKNAEKNMRLSVDEAGVVVTNPIMGHYGSGHIPRKADQAARYGIRQEIFIRHPRLCR